MGPRRFRRGCQAALAAKQLAHDQASMGPRRFRRGCSAPRLNAELNVRRASMGPRRFRRGCPRLWVQWPASRRRFNGAATFPSRMFIHLTSPSSLRPASMGPRRFRRGCLRASGDARSPRPRFNGAATFPSRMLPRLLRSSSPMRSASMGPRRFRRGCVSCQRVRRKRDRLQWGRDVSVADVTQTSKRCSPRSVSFNGAATFPSRMFKRPRCVLTNVEASMGPRRFRRGCHRTSRCPLISRGFNGAATFPSRMSLRIARAFATLRRFNGAATFPSRMSKPPSGIKEWEEASMGPRRFRRGC